MDRQTSKKAHYFVQFWKVLCLNLRANLISFVNMGKKGKSTAISAPTEAEGGESQAISRRKLQENVRLEPHIEDPPSV